MHVLKRCVYLKALDTIFISQCLFEHEFQWISKVYTHLLHQHQAGNHVFRQGDMCVCSHPHLAACVCAVHDEQR